jgi:hypothetical protein
LRRGCWHRPAFRRSPLASLWTRCHTYERIAKSTYTTEDFVNTVLPRMATYSSQAFPPLRQVRKVPRNMVTLLGPLAPRIAGSLAEINLSTHES